MLKSISRSGYFGLKKRSERQFREERIHRLLVPALTLGLTASFLCSLGYFGRLSPNCQEFYDQKPIREVSSHSQCIV